MTTKGILKYIMTTPDNTNPRIVEEKIKSHNESILDFYSSANEKLTDFLYSRTFTKWDYEDGDEFMKRYEFPGMCSSVRVDNYVGRNYDWNYDNTVIFRLFMDASNYSDRYSSFCTASFDVLNVEQIDDGAYDDEYRYLPFRCLDGINENGVYACINVVPGGDKGTTRGTNFRNGRRMCQREIVRYILDYATTAKNALEIIKDIDWFSPATALHGYELHCMICDAEDTFVVEFVDNQIKVIDTFIDNIPIMTNFYLDGFDGTKESLTPYGAGFERWEILRSGAENVSDLDGIKILMQSVYYTKAYDLEGDRWYTEFVGHYDGYGDITNSTPEEEIDPIIEYAHTLFENRDRNRPDTWQTVHCAVYDLVNVSMEVAVQEGTEFYSIENNK